MLLGRLLRFGITGGVTTGVTYLGFLGLSRLGWHYLPAGVVSWAGGMLVSFLMHRRFTFGIRTQARQGREFGAFVGGALLQLGLGLAGYAVLIGQMKIATTPAFIINLVSTASFSFLFMSLVAFRKSGGAQPLQALFAALIRRADA